MLLDAVRVNRDFSEDVLLSSREGEIELSPEELAQQGGRWAMATADHRRPSRSGSRSCASSGPGHVWALGVGIVLVGEFMGWNFAVGKGGAFGALIACWVSGILYTCVAMIDSEVTSTVAAAGGQYAQAKHIIGPLMAFNVGLFLVARLHHAGGRRRHGRRLPGADRWRPQARPRGAAPAALHRPDHRLPGLAELPRRARDADRQLRHHRHRLPRHRRPVHRRPALGSGRGAAARASC